MKNLTLSGANIDYSDYSYNTCYGCANPSIVCQLKGNGCWAEMMNRRFHFIDDWEKPEFKMERMDLPKNIPLPEKRNPLAVKISPSMPIIAVNFMGDMFSGNYEVNKNLSKIKLLIKKCESYPCVIFLFLTKNPMYYQVFDFPYNCYLGTSVLTEHDKYRVKHLRKNKKNIKFVSIEPILGRMNFSFRKIDFIIVGAKTGRNVSAPEIKWINSIKHPLIYYKNNIKKYL